LFPIQWPEPFGLVMTEAMACGTPVIAWRNGEEPRPSTTAGRPRHHGRYRDAASSTTVSHMVVARTTIMAIRM
jgi:glycosyltransferase involved in cell wall biosynthesis